MAPSTGPFTGIQRFPAVRCAADRADLGSRCEPIHADKGSAVFGSLLSDQSVEVSPTSVQHTLAQPGSREALNREGFQGDNLVFVNNLVRYMV